MKLEYITALPDKTPVPIDLAFKAIEIKDPRIALLYVIAKGITILEEREISPLMRQLQALGSSNTLLGGKPLHEPEIELVPVELPENYIAQPDVLAHLYIRKEDFLVLHEELKKNLSTSPDKLPLVPISPSYLVPPKAPELIGTTFYTGQKEIMEALGVSSWKTVKSYQQRGLVITHNPAGKPQTTREEIDRWRNSPQKK
jgi:hypothetical protein